MVGIALALQYIFLAGWLVSLLLILIYTIRKWHLPKISIPAGLLFLSFLFISCYFYYGRKQDEYKASKKFLGYYKLELLDRKKCEDCKVKLKDGYTYDIIKSGKIVGQGEWHLETAIDIPGPFLKIDNGPTSVIWENDRYIDYIDRTPDK
jgi:hypothetical protein